jgi:hypothetical protein
MNNILIYLYLFYYLKLQIITLAELAYDDPYLRPPNADFVKIAEIDHHYPITKVLWEPFRVSFIDYAEYV